MATWPRGECHLAFVTLPIQPGPARPKLGTLPAVSSQAAIEVQALRVVRGGVEVLHEIDLVVPRGEITGLLGPSGCGKSTLMRAIVGVQIVQGGTVTVLGAPAGSPPLRSQVGYVTQAPSVYLDLSVEENLRYFATVVRAGRSGSPR